MELQISQKSYPTPQINANQSSRDPLTSTCKYKKFDSHLLKLRWKGRVSLWGQHLARALLLQIIRVQSGNLLALKRKKKN